MMYVKVCGLRSMEEIDWAVELGYSAIGVVLHPESVRYCSSSDAVKLAEYARDSIPSVAVAKRYEDVAGVQESFNFIQVYEKVETSCLIYAGSSVPLDFDFEYFLYDTSMGSGEFKNFPHWLHPVRSRLIIAGGLNRGNVRTVIEDIKPFGVDVSSGVEITRGKKDYNLMKEFIEEVRDAAR